MTKFRCGICNDSFTAEAELAVCNGVNVKADKRGHPVNEEGERIIGDEPLVLEETAKRVGDERDERGRRRAKIEKLKKRRRLEAHEVTTAGHPATVMEVVK